jgi:polysaccharide deacetylase 2 family uncharacterized protein YibQ
MSTGRKNQSRNNKSRSRRAILLLAVIAACLVAIIILLPPNRGTQLPEVVQPRESVPQQAEEGAPPLKQPPEAEAAGTRRRERPVPKVRVAVVIDDVGYNLEQLQSFLTFPGPISLSVLPNLPHSSESARRVVEAGKELLLHLPMEAVNGKDPGPGVILTTQSDEEIRRLLENSFSQVPQAVGMNNHMGSRATADERVMNVVMEYLRSSRRFYLDSRTTTESVGAGAANLYGVPFLERDIFLDNEPEAEAIQKALESGIQVAREKGHAVLIGHIYNPQIVDVIEQMLGELERAGVELVSVSALLEEMREDS